MQKIMKTIAILSCFLFASISIAGEAEDFAFFEAKVRPLLIEHCYSCHAKDAKKIRGELLLDSKEGWMKGGESGQVIIPGNTEKSLFVKVLSYNDTIQMPPKGKLADKDIAILTEWVKRGAHDPRKGTAPAIAVKKIDYESAKKYWAWQPLKNVAPPKVKDASWCKTPIDHFLKFNMEAKGITPNPVAEKTKLVRRAYLDLLGIPPTPDEVESFLKDKADDAYARLLDRLLQNPHYGERWGRHWLDVARFAESHGYEQDYDRPNAYHYRDFVIKALNQDLPYTTFIKWQLAGDEYEPTNPLAMMATGFLAAGTHATQITASQAEKERYDELDDIVRTVGTTMLGLTIACARCHDHKFDPISATDYYRMASTFSTTVRSDFDLNLGTGNYAKEKADFDSAKKKLEEARSNWERDNLTAKLEAWVKAGAKDAPQSDFLFAEVKAASAKNGTSLGILSNGIVTATGKNPDFETYTITLNSTTKHVTALRLEAFKDAALVKGGPGRAPNGNFALSDFKVTVNPLDSKNKPTSAQPVKFKSVRSSFDQKGLPASASIDSDKKSSWAIDPQFGKDHQAVYELEKPLDLPHGAEWIITLDFNGNNQHNLGKLRVTFSSMDKPALAVLPVPEKTQVALEKLKTNQKLTAAEITDLGMWYRTKDADWQKLNKAVDDFAAKEPKPKLVKALIASEGVPAVRLHTQGADFYDPVHVLKRGDLNQKVSVASIGFPQVLMKSNDAEKHWLAKAPEGSKTSYRRKSLAEWITDTEQGAGMLLARVIVNRVWHYHFGRGIVATPSDFGVQGDKPSNPELLDWLAAEFIRNGWKLKELHKLIMTSAAYMQSSSVDEPRLLKDRENNLVWHFQSRRLEAETIRDSLLAVSGTLDATPFGPGTLEPNHKRRSIYFFVKRSKLIPMMMLFDAPDSLQDLAMRPSTTIAPQALLMMNSSIVRGYADALAIKVLKDAGTGVEAKINRAYQLVLSRNAKPLELKEGVEFLKEQEGFYKADKKPESLALADFCQALFSLNEFVFLD